MSDISAMTETSEITGYMLQMLVLERRNASRNMARFYVLAIEPTLFGEMALVREWGRIGSMGSSSPRPLSKPGLCRGIP